MPSLQIFSYKAFLRLKNKKEKKLKIGVKEMNFGPIYKMYVRYNILL